MYPDLSYLFNDIFGTQVDNWTAVFKTFGLFLALAFFASAYILKLEFLRKEKEGVLQALTQKIESSPKTIWTEMIINSLILFVAGWKLPFIASNFEAFKLDPSSVIFNGNGNFLIGLGLALLGFAYQYYSNKEKLAAGIETKDIKVYPHQKVSDITVVAALSGVAGARIFSISENIDSFLNDPIGQLFSGSGLTVYGGVILATIVLMWYVKKHGIPRLEMCDAGSLALLMGYIVGRMGCQFSGDGDWGIKNEVASPSWWFFPDWAWTYTYPHTVTKQGVPIKDCIGEYCTQLSPGVYPTPVYEIIMCLGIFAFLWSIRRRIKIPGMMFAFYLFFSGIERFLIEFIRVNDRYEFLGFNFSQGQWLSVVSIILGIVGSIYLWKRAERLT